jgi:hypothetical protein
MLNPNRFIQWINVIREEKGYSQYRILENFWASQINSKYWLLENLKNHCRIGKKSSIYIFGGWFGILAQLIRDNYPQTTIYSIDLDEECVYYGNRLSLKNDRINFIVDNMENFNDFSKKTSLIINTSTEHITQKTFDTWLSKVPTNVPIILQGNNFYDCEEHIRCSSSLENFLEMNKMDQIVFKGLLNCTEFNRYMTIGYKT